MAIQNKISYEDDVTGLQWHLKINAAQIVPQGYQGLPPAKATINFAHIAPSMYSQFGIPLQHPLETVYPGLEVANFAMGIDLDKMGEDVNGKRGMAFWYCHFDNANYHSPQWKSGFSASVLSEFGRFAKAPLGWEYRPNDPEWDPKTDPRASASPFLEFRTIQRNLWSNGTMHGFPGFSGEFVGNDWSDGTSVDVATMYDRHLAKIRQQIFVPKVYELGTAAQTIGRDAMTETLSFMLFFPETSKRALWEKLAMFNELLTPQQVRNMYQSYMQPKSSGGTRGTRNYESTAPQQEMATPAVEVTTGNELSQAVSMPLAIPGLWRPAPAVVVVLWPFSLEAMEIFNRPAGVSPDRKGLGW